MSNKSFLYLFILLLTFIFGNVFAQTTGKIAGRVTDKDTGDPIEGANIIIEDKLMGAATDLNGEFFIVNIPPGTYNISGSMMGFTTMRIENIRVRVNTTTSLIFELAPQILEGEVITVTADVVTVKKDQTSSIRTVSTEELQALPVQNLDMVVNMQAGVINGHFRGGRLDEVTYLIDGMNVDNAFTGSEKSVNVDVEVVQELEVITGVFNAEYGRVMSGVVNAVTKDGGNQLSASIWPSVANYFTSHTDIFAGLGVDDYLTRNLSQDHKVQLEGPILKDKLFFLVNYRFQDINGHLNGIRLFNPIDYSEYLTSDPQLWHTESTGDGAYVSMATQKSHNVFGKLTYIAAGNIKIGALFTFNDDVSTSYNHAWKYNPDPRMNYFNTSNLGAITLNHMISKNMFYEMKLSYDQQINESYLYENPLDDRYLNPLYHGRGQTGFVTGGTPPPGKSKDTFTKGNLKFDLYWQLNQNHGIKSGFLATAHKIDRTRVDVRSIYEGTAEESMEVIDPVTGKIDFPNYELQVIPITDETLDIYTVCPYEISTYVQDKMEFDELVINLGLRLDYFNPDQVYPSDLRNPGNQLNLPDSMMSYYKKADPKYQFSPRFGLAYKVGAKAVLRLSYGHFFQMPPMYALYQNNVFRVPTNDYGITMGNTQLEAQKTVSYEIGLWQQIMDEMSLELALYYKDIYNLLSTKIVSTYNQIEYGLFTNKDYGNARGFELKWKYQSGLFLTNLNYTLAYTKGNADNPWQTFNRAGDSRDPIKRYIPMSWDQRHTLNLTAAYSKREYGITATAYYNSGTPYTYTPLGSSELSLINLYTNNDYKPNTFRVDLIGYWRLPMFRAIDARLYLNIYNLFDKLNTQSVYGDTGKPYVTTVTEVDKINYHSNFTDIYDQYQNPSMYSAPRQIKLGLMFQF